tara:strand:+ start:614 stop:841 length:228 start_codon:yes stop_codon:yes gene_type:complete
MKKKEDIEKSIGILNEPDMEILKGLKNTIDSFTKDKAITEEGLQRLENLVTEVKNFTESYMWRLVRMIKRGDMVD